MSEAEVFEFTDPNDGELTQFRVEKGVPQWRWNILDGKPNGWSEWRFARVFSDEWCGDMAEFLKAREWCREHGARPDWTASQ